MREEANPPLTLVPDEGGVEMLCGRKFVDLEEESCRLITESCKFTITLSIILKIKEKILTLKF